MQKDLQASQDFLSRVKEEIDKEEKTEIIVDAGCGDGDEISYLAKKYPQKIFVGYDWKTRPEEYKRNRADNLYFIKAVHQFLPFRQDAIDFLYAHASLDNTPVETESYLEFGMILRWGGKFISDLWSDVNMMLVERCGFAFLRNCKFYENSSGVKHAYVFGASKRTDSQIVEYVSDLKKDLPFRILIGTFP